MNQSTDKNHLVEKNYSSEKLRVIFAGSGEFGLPTLKAVAERHEVVLVVSQEDRPAGRSRKLTPTPVSSFAFESNLPLVKTADINRLALPTADVLVVVAFGQKISPAIVNHPRLGSVNLHASLLPRYRGASPINSAILAGETVTGNSIIRLAEKMDAGAILGQSSRPIEPMQTAGELHDLLAVEGAPLLLEVLHQLASGTAKEIAQDASLVTIARKLSRADSQIDWTRSAEQIGRQICGLWPWPACRVELIDAAGAFIARLSLARARPIQGEGDRWHAGEITIDYGISVAGGMEGIEIAEVQPDGGRLMSLNDYRRGHRWQPGMRLISVV